MTRTAIIGAGPSGLAQLSAFEQARSAGIDVGEVVCFEKQGDWGGHWNYSWRTGLDEHGDPVHGSIYRYMWSNGPKESLELADYSFDEHFGKPIPSFAPREVLFDYLTGRAKKHGVRQYIRFDTVARDVTFVDGAFDVTVESHEDQTTYTERFDYLIVATGHYSMPFVPEYPGFERFPGRILHSHDFRDAAEFAGRDLLILGSSYSAEDIALQTRKYGAASVTIAYRHAPMEYKWPDGVEQVPALQHLDGKTAHFADGSTRDIDAIVLCTGYKHHFPFLPAGLKLETDNSLYPVGLYKGVAWIANPRLMYVGMQSQIYTFPMFDAQARFARDVVLGKASLPDAAAMSADAALWVERLSTVTDWGKEIDYQTDYVRDLLTLSEGVDFDLDLMHQHFYTLENDRLKSIVEYRDKPGFASPVTGTLGLAHHTIWWEALDDSLVTFLGD